MLQRIKTRFTSQQCPNLGLSRDEVDNTGSQKVNKFVSPEDNFYLQPLVWCNVIYVLAKKKKDLATTKASYVDRKN